jgi:hypothetical protein
MEHHNPQRRHPRLHQQSELLAHCVTSTLNFAAADYDPLGGSCLDGTHAVRIMLKGTGPSCGSRGRILNLFAPTMKIRSRSCGPGLLSILDRQKPY